MVCIKRSKIWKRNCLQENTDDSRNFSILFLLVEVQLDRCRTNIRMKLPVYIFDQILKIRWILIAIVLAWIIKLMIYLVTSSNDEIALLSNLFRGKSPWGEFSSCSEETCRAWKTRGNQCSRSGHERYSLIVPLNAREVSVPKSLSFVRKCSRKITRLDIFYT